MHYAAYTLVAWIFRKLTKANKLKKSALIFENRFSIYVGLTSAVCLKDSKNVLHEILANKVWRGPAS